MARKNILVCPLDWGLGHASRMIPLVDALDERGYNVIIVADNLPLILLRQRFPHLSYMRFPSFGIRYSRTNSQFFRTLISIPKIVFHIVAEHQKLKSIVIERKIDLVISDNRYGLWHKRIPSVFITHQLHVKAPAFFRFTEPILNKLTLFFIKKYTLCLIPDSTEKRSLSGDLAWKTEIPQNTFSIGYLSRFMFNTYRNEMKYKYDILVILSGPEPQRSILEKKIISQLKETAIKALIVLGKPDLKENNNLKYTGQITTVNHLTDNELKGAILDIPIVVSRCGYSSIMDFVALGKQAILIPTPGQTEQEYLAEYVQQRKWFHTIQQADVSIEKIIALSKQKLNPLPPVAKKEFLQSIELILRAIGL